MSEDLKEVWREPSRDLAEAGTRQRKSQMQRPEGGKVPGTMRRPVGLEGIVRGTVRGSEGDSERR